MTIPYVIASLVIPFDETKQSFNDPSNRETKLIFQPRIPTQTLIKTHPQIVYTQKTIEFY